MPRIQNQSTGKSRHDPLHVDLAADDTYAKYGNVSKPGRRKKSRHGQHDDEQVCRPTHLIGYLSPPHQAILDPKSSKRIFELARDQQDELDLPDPDDDVIEDSFTRPRNHDLEDADEDDDEQDYHDFSGDEERELVRTPSLPDFGQNLIPWYLSGDRRRRYPSTRCAPLVQPR